MTIAIGQKFGDYRLEALIGTHGIGSFFRARHIALERTITIKVLNDDLLRIPVAADRFVESAHALAILQHPHILPIYEAGEQDGYYYLATEVLSIAPWRRFMRRLTHADSVEALLAGLEVLIAGIDALAYAHTQGIVHGAISPESLLLTYRADTTADDEAYLLKLNDFELAQMVTSEMLIETMAAQGMLAYLAPEQCQGRAPDPRSDIYGVGVLLYKACTGTVPFVISSVNEVLTDHDRAHPTPPRELRPDLPPALEAIILRCLARQPEERFATAAELVTALRRVMPAGASMDETDQPAAMMAPSIGLIAQAVGTVMPHLLMSLSTDEPSPVPPHDQPATGADGVPTSASAPTSAPGDKPQATPGDEPQATPGDEPQAAPASTVGDEPQATPGNEPQATPASEPLPTPGDEPQAAPDDESQAAPASASGDEPPSMLGDKAQAAASFAAEPEPLQSGDEPQIAPEPAPGDELVPAADRTDELLSSGTDTTRIVTPITSSDPFPQLQIYDAQGRLVQVRDLDQPSITIGRHPDNDITLDDPAISRNHVRIDWYDEQVRITDLDSGSGTFLSTLRLPVQTAFIWPWKEVVSVGPFRLHLTPPGAIMHGQAAVRPDSAPAMPMPLSWMRPGERIGIQLDQELLLLTPGVPVPLRLMLANLGTVVDYLSVSVEGVPEGWIQGAEQAMPVTPGVPAPLTLTITVPSTPESSAGDYLVIVRARSSVNPNESATANGRWTVKPFAASSIALTPRTATGIASATYQVTVRNEGNVPARYFISADDAEQHLDYEFTQNDLTIDPGQAATVPLTVSASRRLIGVTRTRQFTVWTEMAGAADQRVVGRFVQPPMIPSWVILLLSGLVLLWVVSGILGGQRVPASQIAGVTTPTGTIVLTPEPGAPVIRRFTVFPLEVAPGQPVTVVWDVEGADRVQIEQFGDVQPQGERDHRPEVSTEYRLTAFAGELMTTRVEQVVVNPQLTAPDQPLPAPEPTAERPSPDAATPLPTSTPAATPEPTPIPGATPEPTPIPGATPLPEVASSVNILELVAEAAWLSSSGEVLFGDANDDPATNGLADLVDTVMLEDGVEYNTVLLIQPPLITNGFLEGEFLLKQPLPANQYFLAEIGFAQNASGAEAQVQLIFDNFVVYETTKLLDGTLQSVRVDLSPFEGSSGPLILRVENGDDGVVQDGIYWIAPRIGVAP